MRRRLVALLFPVLAPALAPAQGVDWVKANYTKYEHRIPMRDGAKLFTAVYVPKEMTEKLPILLVRTPYSVAPYGADQYRKDLGPSEAAAKEKFIFAYQDVRGRFMSEGEFVDMRPYVPVKKAKEIDETTDTWDTIDWLVKNVPGNSGRVGQWGISYPGFYSSMGMIDAHPALLAVSPQAPIADWFVGDDFHHNGVFYLPHAFNFFASFGKPRKGLTTKSEPRFEHGTPDGYDYFLRLPPLSEVNAKVWDGKVAFWDEIVQHDSYDGYWKERNVRPHIRNVKPAVMVVGGWFDAEDLFGALATYQALRTQSPATEAHLVMGPWVHGGWARTDGDGLGQVHFNDKTSLSYREKVELPFFVSHLKGKGEAKLAGARVFETGRNEWHDLPSWPPKGQTRTFYLRAEGKLSPEPPSDGDAYDEYVSDPRKPVPYVGDIAIGMTREHMAADQRHASSRPDVLVYETEPLEEDLAVAGPLEPRLFVSTSGTDSDFVVKLVDVYPSDFPDPEPNPANVRLGGYQQLVRGEAFRGKFRNGFDKPQAFRPNERAEIAFTMPDVYHTFRRGHRVMVQVQSTWFPLVDRNPQKFMNVFQAGPADYQKATERVYRTKDAPSGLTINVVR